jgi:Ca2+-binding RTX toxin-like protein
VQKRKELVDLFWEQGILDTESNVSFGEGGAGAVGARFSRTVLAVEETTSQLFSSIENIIGSSNNDNIVGNSSKNTLRGGAGDDKIYGKAGADSLYGDTGNDTMIGGGMSGAVTGAMLGAGTRFGSMKYAAGVNSFINSTTDSAGKVFAGTRRSLDNDVSNFKWGHFTRSDVQNTHSNYWKPNYTGIKQTRFQDYNPLYTPAVNPSGAISTGKLKQIDEYTAEYI